MLTRIKQFITAVNPKLRPNQLNLIHSYLNHAEQALFFSMDKVDQKHCADVASTCLKLICTEPLPVNRNLLIKASLLHDVGKLAGDMGLWERVWIVLLGAFWPARLLQLGKQPNSAYYIALNHAAIGAQRCKMIQCPPELVRLVALHQSGGAGVELKLLVASDKQN